MDSRCTATADITYDTVRAVPVTAASGWLPDCAHQASMVASTGKTDHNLACTQLAQKLFYKVLVLNHNFIIL